MLHVSSYASNNLAAISALQETEDLELSEATLQA